MKRFAMLYAELDESNRTSEKLAALERYFREAPPEDAAWGLSFLSGRRTKRALSYNVLRRCALAASGLPEWLLEECVSAVGDFSETLSLILPPGSAAPTSPPLREIVERYILPLPSCTEAQAEALLWEVWSRLGTRERFVYHKLLSVNFRVGVQRRLVARALANVAGIDPAVMEHRLAGEYKASSASFAAIVATESEIDDVTKPYPFCLASQLEAPPPPSVDASRWQIEWKWDGIRAQLIRRTDAQGNRRVVVWSRGEELITDQFPELKQIAAGLPCDAVLDGEVLAWDDEARSNTASTTATEKEPAGTAGPPNTEGPRYRGKPLSFAVLQTRLNRKGVAPGLFDRTDLVFMAYDVLEVEGRDIRSRPLAERRRELERIANLAPADLPLRLSRTLRATSWEEVGALRERATTHGAEGLMLKPLESAYGVGRVRGDLAGEPSQAGWWKWKIDPLSLDAVLIAAQPGSGKRASLFTDLTFGLWHEGALVSFAKAYSGLDDAEIARVDAFVRRNTLSKAGPVRLVKPQLVFEIAFEAIRESTRHKSGIAVRFPRIARWRQDKKPEDADTLENARGLLNLNYGSMTPTAPSKKRGARTGDQASSNPSRRSRTSRSNIDAPPPPPDADIGQLFPDFGPDSERPAQGGRGMIGPAERWFASRGWTPFDFQVETWRAYLAGESGLVNAPTGLGKSLSVWMGPILEYLHEQSVDGRTAQSAPAPERAKRSSATRSSLRAARNTAEPLRVLWITPMRALAADTTLSLLEPVRDLALNWTVESRTGDTAQSLRKTQREKLPTALVTTPESLTLLLSYPDSHEKLASLRCVVVDEWHELLSTKRGVQTELALARLRAWNPRLRTWGLSATLGNLAQAMKVLVGNRATDFRSEKSVPEASHDARAKPQRPPPAPPAPRLITGSYSKSIEIETLIPADIERFPWAGHLGLRLLPQVIAAIDRPRRGAAPVGQSEGAASSSTDAPSHATSLLFTNTRSQAEIWFRAITHARPDWLGTIAIHHGSIDHAIRGRVEAMLKSGAARCVVCTSSLDLGVDFSPVDQVIQVGSPKGIARLMQRAGRSGHQPGALSRIVCVPAHAFELMEFAAVRDALAARRIESREPIDKPFDVLVQHLVTIAMGGGFVEHDLLREVRTTHAYASLANQEWTWAMDFVRRGGPTLEAYPQYARITDSPMQHPSPSTENALVHTPHAPFPIPTPPDPLARASGLRPKAQDSPDCPRPWTIASRKIATLHRMSIGTITSDSMISIRFLSGRTLGAMEESFIARLEPGDRFVFSGRILEFVRVRDMTAYVQRSRKKGGVIPVWNGGRMPLSTQLSDGVRLKLEEARQGRYDSNEMRSIQPLLEIQRERSRIPAPDELLVERVSTRDGDHVIVMPFDGRLVHEGLAALCAHRIAKLTPISVHATATDYGFDLHTPRGSHSQFEIGESVLRTILSEDDLLDDLLACLNSTELARRRFRDVARIAGLILQGYPGQRKPTRHLQASSEMFFDVFEQFDAGNLLLHQARREVLEEQLEVRRLRHTLQRIAKLKMVIVDTARLTPLAFPVWAEVLRGVHASSETWSQRVARMSAELEAETLEVKPEGGAAPRPKRVATPSKGKRRTKRAKG